MKTTYEMTFNAPDNALAEQAVRMMDKMVRRWYNVHGGKRTYSGKGAGGEWYIFMEYTANWDATSLHIWPDFNDLQKAFIRKLWKVDRDNLVEVHSRPMPGKG